MPYVSIEITREGATAGQKATRLPAETLGKNLATTIVVIEKENDDYT